jgi:hypothetical protein
MTSEYRTQRNVLLTAGAALAAIGLGFLIGRTTANPSAPAEDRSVYDTQASPPATSMADASTEMPATAPAGAPAPGTRYTPAPAAGSAAPASRPSSTPVTERPAPRPVETVTVTVPAGTKIELALENGLSSQTAGVGDAVVAEVTETIYVDGRAAIPAGSMAAGSVTEARPLRKIGGRGLLAVTFDHIEVPGDEASITAAWRREGKSETAKDAATIAAGAAVGTVVGNQAKKNDRGKVIGGILGGAIGTVIAAETEGEPVELAAGSHLTLTLRDPVEIRVRG